MAFSLRTQASLSHCIFRDNSCFYAYLTKCVKLTVPQQTPIRKYILAGSNDSNKYQNPAIGTECFLCGRVLRVRWVDLSVYRSHIPISVPTTNIHLDECHCACVSTYSTPLFWWALYCTVVHTHLIAYMPLPYLDRLYLAGERHSKNGVITIK